MNIEPSFPGFQAAYDDGTPQVGSFEGLVRFFPIEPLGLVAHAAREAPPPPQA